MVAGSQGDRLGDYDYCSLQEREMKVNTVGMKGGRCSILGRDKET
jgi:hypothetical protein